MPEDRACRFCGLPLEDANDKASGHDACINADPVDERPEPFLGHPMYGPRPGPYFIQQG